MDLRNQILKEHSKRNCTLIVDWVGANQSRFNELFALFLYDQYRVTQRAFWPVSYCAIAYPELMENNFDRLIKHLQKPGIHNFIKRNTVRLLQKVDIPEKYESEIMDICFTYLESPAEAVAIKAFSLSVLGKLAKKYPEIIPEIKLHIENQLPHQTAAFKSRAKQVLKEFKESKSSR